jgi:lipid II:glycine glycyltransferase (peptidoglycan interpeptide bridge formation enzyme)
MTTNNPWPVDLDGWNELIAGLPGAHILQTRQWAEVKSLYGWTPLPRLWKDVSGKVKAAALILERTVSPLKLRVQYAPRGPLLDWSDARLRDRVLDDLQSMARKRRAIFIKVDPELIVGTGVPGAADAVETETGSNVLAEFGRRGWRFSDEQIQFRNTVWVSLEGSEEDRLGRLKQKWRYNLRLAQRKGVQVRQGQLDDLPKVYKMYAETSVRDGFVIRSEEYYRAVWQKFMENAMATPLIAELEGEAIAGLMLFHFAGRAWYLYGMSTQSSREKMPNYLLQWEAMSLAVQKGCTVYDLWGAPDLFDESDRMWGVFRFKEGMGGEVVRTGGAWDYAASPIIYPAYTRLLPRLLDILRRRGRAQTKHEVSL